MQTYARLWVLCGVIALLPLGLFERLRLLTGNRAASTCYEHVQKSQAVWSLFLGAGDVCAMRCVLLHALSTSP